MKKIIEINDWSDPSELKKTISRLQNRRKTVLRQLGYDQIHFNGSKYNLDHILPALEAMLDHRLPEEESGRNNYYIYFHCNPLKKLFVKNDIKHLFLAKNFPGMTHVPFYVGKGTGNRAYQFERSGPYAKIRAKLRGFDLEPSVFIAKSELSENQAFNLESKIIDILGVTHLEKHGLLVNLDEGSNHHWRRHHGYATSEYADMIKKILKRNKFI
jgi:hypothetical protein